MSMLAKQAATFAELQQCLVTAARDLFDAHGIEVQHTPEGAVDPTSRSVMAIIGYAADGLAGALVLLCSEHVVGVLTPDVLRLRADIAADNALRDVLGEFANMLVGRIKNKLVARGIVPLLATPTTVIGEGLQLPVPRSGMSAWHRFSSSVGDIFVRLDATLGSEFELGDHSEAQSPAIAEGEMVLF